LAYNAVASAFVAGAITAGGAGVLERCELSKPLLQLNSGLFNLFHFGKFKVLEAHGAPVT
jgi:hypothetical protein